MSEYVGKRAELAGGVEGVAPVAGELEEALLGGGVGGEAAREVGEHALAGQAQDGVVVARGPGVVVVGGQGFVAGVAAGAGADPEPGQDHVHRQFGGPRRSEQGLGLGGAV